MVHLVYCDNAGKKGEKVLDKIIDGRKCMVVRGAVGRKIPHSRVFANETLYFMEKGSGLIMVKATVKDVQNLVKLSDEESMQALKANQDKLALSQKQQERWHKKCLCFVEFADVEVIEPLVFEHQRNMDDWLILEKIEDVLTNSSIKYNYENARFVK